MQYVITGVCALCLLKANNPVFNSCNNAALPDFFSWRGLSPPHPLPPEFIFLGVGGDRVGAVLRHCSFM